MCCVPESQECFIYSLTNIVLALQRMIKSFQGFVNERVLDLLLQC